MFSMRSLLYCLSSFNPQSGRILSCVSLFRRGRKLCPYRRKHFFVVDSPDTMRVLSELFSVSLPPFSPSWGIWEALRYGLLLPRIGFLPPVPPLTRTLSGASADGFPMPSFPDFSYSRSQQSYLHFSSYSPSSMRLWMGNRSSLWHQLLILPLQRREVHPRKGWDLKGGILSSTSMKHLPSFLHTDSLAFPSRGILFFFFF